MSQAIDGATIDGGDFEITARDLNGDAVIIDDATLTVKVWRCGKICYGLLVSTQRYIHVQSATLAGLDGDAKLVMASADPVAVEQSLYSSENDYCNWGTDTFGNGATFDFTGTTRPTVRSSRDQWRGLRVWNQQRLCGVH